MLEELLIKLMDKMDNNNIHYDKDFFIRAFHYGEKAHEGQKRKSGEPYYVHPISVAEILVDLNMDQATIIAGLLHDVIEDTDATFKDIEDEFSAEIATIVDGVTKLKQIKYKSREESQAENVRKMVVAMTDDIRVIIVKLADRVHNMRTLEFMRQAKQFEISRETLEIYSPLADRLGISTIKWELEDLSLRYLDPTTYQEIVTSLNKKLEEREAYIDKIIGILHHEIEDQVDEAEISGRPKHIYSIYNKMTSQNKSIDQIFDLTAIRVIVNSIRDCYAVLGSVHSLWKPLTGRFKDYIAMPKANMYQSLHTTVIGPGGEIFEVQIRTWDMHKTAEYGIAAHWQYKEGGPQEKDFAEKLSWLKQLRDWQKEDTEPKEFMETLKGDFFSDDVYVFTPLGDVIALPTGSTPIDFAYRIHSAVGNNCVGAKIDNRIVPLNTKLKNGNIVEVLTSTSSSGPSIDWLDIVKSNQARTKIRQFFKKTHRDENIVKGRESLEKEVTKEGYQFNKILKKEWLEEIANRMSFTSIDDLYSSIGFGTTPLTQVVPKLKNYYNEYYRDELALEEITIRKQRHEPTRSVQGLKFKGGVDNLEVNFAKCCNPVPGDDILAYITRGRGVSIHRTDCPNMANIDTNRTIDVSWDEDSAASFNIHLNVLAYDRIGYLADISDILQGMDLNIENLNAKLGKDKTFLIDLIVEIKDREQLSTLFEKIRGTEGTVNCYRVKSQ